MSSIGSFSSFGSSSTLSSPSNSRSSTPTTFSDDDDNWNNEDTPEKYSQLQSITDKCNRSDKNFKKDCQSYSCLDRTNNTNFFAYDCDWQKYYDNEAKAFYYYNKKTGEASWIPKSFFNGGLKKYKKTKTLRKKTKPNRKKTKNIRKK